MEFDEEQETPDYYRFTGKQRLESAVSTMKGLMLGIVSDQKVNDAEMRQLTKWLSEYREFSERHPFNEIIPKIQEVIADGQIDEEERADILWLAGKFDDPSYYDGVTAAIQELHGFIAGILADGIVVESELKSLGDWLDDHQYLRSCWPYDEIDSLVTAVMADGKIDDAEQEILQQFFSQFVGQTGNRSVAGADKELSIEGICASCPEIAFEGHLFCFTGKSNKGNRDYLVEVVEARGGAFHKALRNDTNFLVVGAGGNSCWAYSCYGRKIEDAVRRRQQGQKLVIVHEYDFWDEVEV